MPRIRLVAWLLLGLCFTSACDHTPADPAPAEPGVPGEPEPPEEPEVPGPTGGTPYVVLLSLDGFHPDYFDLSHVHLARVMSRGVRAELLEPVFPTLTFPNHLSQVTGLYPDRHGIVANSFWDPDRGQWYSLNDPTTVTDGTWYSGEPIWSTAERQGVRAASFFWPGSEAEIAGYRPSMYKRYDGTVPNAARVDTVLAWLRLEPEARPHFITLYMSDVDSEGHRAGPDASGIQTAVERVDLAIGRLLDGLDALPQRDSIYLIVTSDHGMVRYEANQWEAFESYADMGGVFIAAAGPYANLFVAAGDTAARRLRDQLNAGLQNGRAYLRSEVPADLHFRLHRRVGDVVVVMDAPWQIKEAHRPLYSGGGHHGWAPGEASMAGIFLAMGPDLPAGRRIGRVRTVDLHPFMAELLGIDPAADIDGEPGAIRSAIDG